MKKQAVWLLALMLSFPFYAVAEYDYDDEYPAMESETDSPSYENHDEEPLPEDPQDSDVDDGHPSENGDSDASLGDAEEVPDNGDTYIPEEETPAPEEEPEAWDEY